MVHVKNESKEYFAMLRPGISLCMIVKDEEEQLPDFLEKTRELWDELCVVDTGSKDRTKQIILDSGGVLDEMKWENDFAAARNKSLRLAQRDWIVYLDPDEHICPELVKDLRDVTQIKDAGAATFIMRDYWPSGHHREKRLLRMFRNRRNLHFKVPIHEEISSSVAVMLEREKLKLIHSHNYAEHFGYQRDLASQKDKKNRDLKILKKVLERNPDDLYSWYRLLDVARYWNDQLLMRTQAQNALRSLHRNTSFLNRPYLGDLLVIIANGLFPKNSKEQLFFLRGWVHRISEHPALYAQLGVNYEAVGQFSEARECYLRCLDLESVSGDISLITVTPTLGLARLALVEHQYELAFHYVEGALALNPRAIDTIFTALGICGAAAGQDGIDDLTAAYKQKYGETPEMHNALGEYYYSKKLFSEAIHHLQISAGDPPQGRAALKLSQALFALGRYKESKESIAYIESHYPEAKLAMWMIEQCTHLNHGLHQNLVRQHVQELLKPWLSILPLSQPVSDSLSLIGSQEQEKET